MHTVSLKILFEKHLDKLYSEIHSYSKEKNLWIIDHNIHNSGGNLCLHLIGNLNTYIAAELGASNYIRQRDLEFSLKNVPKAHLLDEITNTKKMVLDTIGKLAEDDLHKEYPKRIFDDKMTIGYFLIHLNSHLTYHLGQINYHRRLLDL